MDSQAPKPQNASRVWLYDFDELRRAVAELELCRSAVGKVNPRNPGWHNDLIQLLKKVLARIFSWYTRPLDEFNATVSRSLQEIDRALDDLSVNIVTLEWRLAQSEKRSAALAQSIQEQAKASVNLQQNPNLETPSGRTLTSLDQQAHENSRIYIYSSPGNFRTAYVVGLFGSGRLYTVGLILHHIGERAKYFRDTIRFHPGPTPMIYSGHATIRYVSGAQFLPTVTSRVLESARAGFADLMFVYRHPLDSLLTNWVWWRTYIRDSRKIYGVSEVYKNTDDLCADLEQNFSDFEAFVKGYKDFLARLRGPRFLSFPEFVEETELHIQAATLTLRFEDFMVDPLKQFSKIVELMSVDCDLSRLRVDPPWAKPYGYLAVKEKVPRFRNFIDALDAETKRRIERIGYNLGA